MVDPDPLIRPQPLEGDTPERTLRPERLADFTGQAEARANLGLAEVTLERVTMAFERNAASVFADRRLFQRSSAVHIRLPASGESG